MRGVICSMSVSPTSCFAHPLPQHLRTPGEETRETTKIVKKNKENKENMHLRDPRPEPPLNGRAHEGPRVGAAGRPGDAPWWLSFLRVPVLLSNAGGVDCGLEYLFRCLFFGITLIAGFGLCRVGFGSRKLAAQGKLGSRIRSREGHVSFENGKPLLDAADLPGSFLSSQRTFQSRRPAYGGLRQGMLRP
ncbi:hypothetical protein VTG60DRAFT_1852 [Thermothelomyces hinnuleus]